MGDEESPTSLRWAGRPLGAGDLASSQSPVESPAGDGESEGTYRILFSPPGVGLPNHMFNFCKLPIVFQSDRAFLYLHQHCMRVPVAYYY